MPARLQVSKTLLALVKAFEGYRALAARLPNGRWTIGYGHTQAAREGGQVSKADAEALLIYDLMTTAAAIKPLISTILTQNQFDALCAFAFSVGLTSFRDSKVLGLVNEGHLLQAAGAMELWRRTEFEGEDIVVDGLVRRRVAEMALFLTPSEGWSPSPSPVLRPSLDPIGVSLAEAPTVLMVPLEGLEARARRLGAHQVLSVHNIEVPLEPDSTADNARAVSSPIDAAMDLPAPSWPVCINDGGSAFVLTAPAEMAGEPVMPTKLDLGPPTLVPDDVPDLFDLHFSGEQPEFPPAPQTRAELGNPDQRDQGSPRAHSSSPAGSPPFDLAPAVGLGLLGAVFIGGGLYWSASGGSPGGVLNPWIVGWLACLGGMTFMAIAAYLLLRHLGHIDPHDSGLDTAAE